MAILNLFKGGNKMGLTTTKTIFDENLKGENVKLKLSNHNYSINKNKAYISEVFDETIVIEFEYLTDNKKIKSINEYLENETSSYLKRSTSYTYSLYLDIEDIYYPTINVEFK